MCHALFYILKMRTKKEQKILADLWTTAIYFFMQPSAGEALVAKVKLFDHV